ncbi:nitrilase-related carbon-nitrogen hydrolase [Catenuloplanes atrovinosus]|uniref:Apolipoprotein N-acyltransferase n=1 Tax=Catenuloplanes atrovinosus TaxID=137266 RepID=A0AAE3YR71_9ACTN|nr:nitrilase-related carbon-nitrogen hydrolase [Catenuloplanes atrovinosus]MDR7277156.1 apolipoprotein N-acyltransferase [Catenuloplanes atrovinosus]
MTRARYACLALGAIAALLSTGGRWDVSIAAWVAPVLLLRFVRTGPLTALPAVAAVTIAAALLWMVQLAVPVTALTLAGIAGFGVVLWLPYAADRLIVHHGPPVARLLMFPLALMSAQFLLGTFGPFGTAYGLHAAILQDWAPLVQLSAVTGPYAIAFLVGAAATVVNLVWETGRLDRVAIGYAALLALVIAGGQARLIGVATGEPTVRVAGINPSQAAIDAETAVHGASRLAVTDPRTVRPEDVRAAAPALLDDLFGQTRTAARGGAKIVMWSENAARVVAADKQSYLDRAARVADEEDVYLLVAELTYLPAAPFGTDQTHLFDPDGRLRWDYDKARPIPGLEIYRPGGHGAPVIDTEYGRISSMICYDVDFPAITHVDADIMLVPGGDWPEMGRTHTDMASLRGIENGYSLVRQDFNGQSTAYDAAGRVLSTQDTTTDSGIWYATVPVRSPGTPYRFTGEVSSWLALAGVLTLAATSMVARRRSATQRAHAVAASG